MSMRRFMVASASVCNGISTIEGELYNHIVRVLRLGIGTKVLLVDEQGTEYCGILDQLGKRSLSISIVSTSLAAVSAADTPRITICQALPKGEKIDLILQKGTELGAHDFRVFGGQRSVAKVRNDQQRTKLDRWNRITSEAARQCGRIDIPAVTWMSDVVRASDNVSHHLRLVLWENEREQSLKSLFSSAGKPSSIIVAIGPEGGFATEELQCLTNSGFQPVSLGSRILRTETAAIAILSIMQYMWDGL